MAHDQFGELTGWDLEGFHNGGDTELWKRLGSHVITEPGDEPGDEREPGGELGEVRSGSGCDVADRCGRQRRGCGHRPDHEVPGRSERGVEDERRYRRIEAHHW